MYGNGPAPLFQSKKRLIQLLVGKSAEYNHCIGELFSVINFFRRCHVRQICQHPERLAVIFECDMTDAHTKRKQCTFHFLFTSLSDIWNNKMLSLIQMKSPISLCIYCNRFYLVRKGQIIKKSIDGCREKKYNGCIKKIIQ